MACIFAVWLISRCDTTVFRIDQILKKDDTKIFRSNQSIKKAELCPMGADELSSHKDPGLHKFTFHLER